MWNLNDAFLTTFPKKRVLPAAWVQVRPRNLVNMLVMDKYGGNSKPASMVLTSGIPEPRGKKRHISEEPTPKAKPLIQGQGGDSGPIPG